MCQIWGAVTRAHAQGSIPDLEAACTDCAQIWYTVREQLVGCRAKVSWDPVGTCAHAGCRFLARERLGRLRSNLAHHY